MTPAADGDHTVPVTDAQLRIAAGLLAYVVATVHLFHPQHGGRRLLTLLAANPAVLATDPRPLAFVLSGFALVAGVLYVQRGGPERPIVGAGIGLMLVYLFGYFGWHLSGHGGFLPNRDPLYHDLTPVEATLAHLTGDALAAAAVASELALLAVLVLLYRRLAPVAATARDGHERNP